MDLELTGLDPRQDDIIAIESGLNGDNYRRTPPGLNALHRDLTGLRRAHAGAAW